MILDVKFSELVRKLDVTFSELARSLDVDFSEQSMMIAPVFGEYQKVTEYLGEDPYAGDYIVTPKVVEQTIPTKDKYMLENMEVKQIPFFDVGNNSGGRTIYIGSEI